MMPQYIKPCLKHSKISIFLRFKMKYFTLVFQALDRVFTGADQAVISKMKKMNRTQVLSKNSIQEVEQSG